MFRKISCLLALISLISPNPLAASEISWTGCGITKHAFMNEIADAFEERTGMKIRLSGGGSTKGIRSPSAGASDLGGSCRIWLILPGGVVHPQEINAKLIHVGWDALVPIVHQKNPLKNISLNKVKEILNGKINNWADLGWLGSGEIIPCTRESNLSGVGYMVRKILFNDTTYKFKGRSIKFKSSTSLEQKN
jgi:phosphate transport system substrate-binding protein